jgi:hypothetical protein
MRNRLAISVLLPLLILCLCSCGRGPSFDEEYQLSIRAGKGELTESEIGDLKKKNHIILMQMADPTTLALLKGFAGLSSSCHRMLRTEGYLKWNFAELSAAARAPFQALVESTLAMAKAQGVQPIPGFSLDALEKAQVGYAIVEVGKDQDQKVVSLFILWPDLPDPSWKTVVNGRLAGAQDYFSKHLINLKSLKTSLSSPLP